MDSARLGTPVRQSPRRLDWAPLVHLRDVGVVMVSDTADVWHPFDGSGLRDARALLTCLTPQACGVSDFS